MIKGSKSIHTVTLYSVKGEKNSAYKIPGTTSAFIPREDHPPGLYIVLVELENGDRFIKKAEFF